MDIAYASFAVVLPWSCGSLLVACLWRYRRLEPSAPYALGYGWPLGIVLLILWMRFLSLAGSTFSVAAVASPFVLLLIGLPFALCKLRAVDEVSHPVAGWRAMAFWGKAIWWGLLALLALRGGQYLLEILWRPSFGWDSWTQWATKAKVWYSLGTMVPFGSSADVLAGAAQYTDANPHYPPGIPLMQVWMALCLGRWDDTLINLPWLAFGLALGFAFYAQLRAAKAGPLFSLGATYLLLSLPFLGVHLALPGYADLPLAVLVGLASISFWRWSVERRWEHLAPALILAWGSSMLKTPGWIWLALLAPPMLPVLLGRRGWKLLFALGGAGVAVLFVLAQYDLRILGYQLHAGFQPVGRPLAETTLLTDNWHLLWYSAMFALALRWRTLASERLAALTVYLGGGLAFLFVVFFFSNAALWVSDFSTVNRALLHLTPTLAFALALLALDLKDRIDSRALPIAGAPSDSQA